MALSVSQEVAKIFDYKIPQSRASSIKIEIPEIPQQFRIGYITGSSGSGKTHILKHLGSNYEWLENRAIITDNPIVSHFSSAEKAIDRLNMAGFSSVPHWFHKYTELSSGQQMRVMIALGLQSYTLVDEFTSNLDRLTAICLSTNLRKYVDTHHLTNIIVAGCQRDIVEWLKPCWIYDTDTCEFSRPEFDTIRWECVITSDEASCRDIRERVLSLSPCHKSKWKRYAATHYLSGNILDNSQCWEGWVRSEGVPKNIGFIATTTMPHGSIKNGIREHRLVVLPFFQGMGLGVLMSETIADHYLERGKRYFSKTSHPKLGNHRDKSSSWRPTRLNHRIANVAETSFWKPTVRECYSHEYIGKTKPVIRLSAKKDIFPETELEWKPLRIYGIVKSNDVDIVTVLNHTRKIFPLVEYGTREKALIAAQKYLTLESLTRKTNLYKIDNNTVKVKSGDRIFTISACDLNLIKGHYWSFRTYKDFVRVVTRINKKRVYIESLLTGVDYSLVHHINGDMLDNTRANLSVTSKTELVFVEKPGNPFSWIIYPVLLVGHASEDNIALIEKKYHIKNRINWPKETVLEDSCIANIIVLLRIGGVYINDGSEFSASKLYLPSVIQTWFKWDITRSVEYVNSCLRSLCCH